jgi:hypothetical protein
MYLWGVIWTDADLFARGNDVFPVEAGDVLEGFRIDAVREGYIELTWVAHGEKQSMPLSSPAATGTAPRPRLRQP